MDLKTLLITAAVAALASGIAAWAYWYFNRVLWPIQRRKAVSRKPKLPPQTGQAIRVPVQSTPKAPGAP